MKKRLRQLLEKIGLPIVGYGLLLLICLLVVGAFVLLGSGILALLGLQYRSVGSLFLFLIAAGILDIPIDIFFSALPRALVSLGWLNETWARVFKFVCGILLTMLELLVVDWFMDSITATPLAVCGVAVCFEVIDVLLDKAGGGKDGGAGTDAPQDD